MTTITDGTAVFAVRDKRMQAMVDMFYPVGSVYLCADPAKTKDDFEFMQYGTWEELPSAKCLETADSSHVAGSTVGAGLPNLTGEYDGGRCGCHTSGSATATGVFAGSGGQGRYNGAEGDWKNTRRIYFDASKSNSIYGASNTVQPNAYFIKAWRRTA